MLAAHLRRRGQASLSVQNIARKCPPFARWRFPESSHRPMVPSHGCAQRPPHKLHQGMRHVLAAGGGREYRTWGRPPAGSSHLCGWGGGTQLASDNQDLATAGAVVGAVGWTVMAGGALVQNLANPGPPLAASAVRQGAKQGARLAGKVSAPGPGELATGGSNPSATRPNARFAGESFRLVSAPTDPNDFGPTRLVGGSVRGRDIVLELDRHNDVVGLGIQVTGSSPLQVGSLFLQPNTFVGLRRRTDGGILIQAKPRILLVESTSLGLGRLTNVTLSEVVIAPNGLPISNDASAPLLPDSIVQPKVNKEIGRIKGKVDAINRLLSLSPQDLVAILSELPAP